MTRLDSPVPLIRNDPDRSWITDPDPDHPKGRNAASVCHPTSTFLVSSPLHRFAQQGDYSWGENCVSNMAAKVRFDLPWLLSSLDNSGVKNGLALIGKTHFCTFL